MHSGQQLFMEPYGHHTACGGHYQCGMWKIIAIMPAVQLEFGVASAVGFGRLIADISHWFLKRRGIVMAMAIVASGNYLSGSIWTLVLADTLNTQRLVQCLYVPCYCDLGCGDPHWPSSCSADDQKRPTHRPKQYPSSMPEHQG